MIRKLRLGSGLFLFAYVTTHLVNHSLGLISLDAMEAGRQIFTYVWTGYVGLTLLAAAFAIHIALAFWSLYRRETLRMHPWEAIQLVLGLAIPIMLVEHVVGTIVLRSAFDVKVNYIYEVLVLWVLSPVDGILLAITLVVVWLHGCIGLHFWLRLKRFYRPCQPYALAIAVTVPVTALLGFTQAGQQIGWMTQTDAQLREIMSGLNLPTNEEVAGLVAFIVYFRYGFGGAIAIALGARQVRRLVRRRRGVVRLTYPGSRIVESVPGMTVLEASRAAGLPHASVCGGRGRCSTCRVRLGAGRDTVTPPDEDELRVLQRVGAPPHVRLACQLRPGSDLEVTPLLPPDATPRQAYGSPAHLAGQEREIAILFADLRSFTKFSETKLPYDVVFILNRYFRYMGEAIEESGGRLDKFIGDGVMALFGINSDGPTGATQALIAAKRMAARLDELNRSLAQELEEPLRMGIGIHLGHAIVGEMGYADATGVTAVGDTVNTASRLEALTKELGAQLVVSEDLIAAAGVDLSGFPRQTVEIRGRGTAIGVRVLEDARSLPV